MLNVLYQFQLEQLFIKICMRGDGDIPMLVHQASVMLCFTIAPEQSVRVLTAKRMNPHAQMNMGNINHAQNILGMSKGKVSRI